VKWVEDNSLQKWEFLYSFTNSIEIPIILCYNKEKEYHPQKEDTL